MRWNVNPIAIGDSIGSMCFGPISRHTLALFCGGSGDHNPIHVDFDYARSVGLDDVVVHGMLQMAVLGRLICQWVPQERIRSFQARFECPVKVADVLECVGTIAAIREDAGQCIAVLDLVASTQGGVRVIVGSAEVDVSAIDGRSEP